MSSILLIYIYSRFSEKVETGSEPCFKIPRDRYLNVFLLADDWFIIQNALFIS